jgi:hypothetical protein
MMYKGHLQAKVGETGDFQGRNREPYQTCFGLITKNKKGGE